MLVQQIINGIVVGSVYALTAMGATLVYGIMRILDISNAGAYAIGAYVAFFFLLQTGSPLVALVTGVVLTAAFGFLVQKFLYAPLMNKSPNVSLIAGIGLFTIFMSIALSLFSHYLFVRKDEKELSAVFDRAMFAAVGIGCLAANIIVPLCARL